MNRFVTALMAILLLGCGTYVFAATGGNPGSGSNAAVTQYEPKTPENPTTPTYTPAQNPKSETGNRTTRPDQQEVSNKGRGPGDEQEVSPETATSPVETAATGPAGGATGLPFTGLDLLLLIAIGALLVGLGLLPKLRRSQ